MARLIHPRGLGPKRSPCHECDYASVNKKDFPCGSCQARRLYDDYLSRTPYNVIPLRRWCKNGCNEVEERLGLCWRCLEREKPDPYDRPVSDLMQKSSRSPRKKRARKLHPNKRGRSPCIMGDCPEMAMYEDGYCKLCSQYRRDQETHWVGVKTTTLSRIMVSNRISHYTEKDPTPELADRYRSLLFRMRGQPDDA